MLNKVKSRLAGKKFFQFKKLSEPCPRLPSRQSGESGDLLGTIFFYFAILFFIIGFGFRDAPPSFGWYQQFMPNLGNEQINDIVFIDSLMGFAIASKNINPDTSSIIKTTNGGDNWQVVFTQTPKRFSRIKFINSNIGFICGGSGGGTPQLYKTTDAGLNWFLVSSPSSGAIWADMSVLNEDTIWLADPTSSFGGVFRTTNGGLNWTVQYNGNNPGHIYMYNRNIGFISDPYAGALYRTTNSGLNWIQITGTDGFEDMSFIDSLTGWKCPADIPNDTSMQKTTDGGLTWVKQNLPSGGNIASSIMIRFSNINADTIWGVGGAYRYGFNQYWGMIWKTTNGGTNWGYQLPDSSIHITGYGFSKFINKLNGWAYTNGPTGIHTITGGDTVTYFTAINATSNKIPNQFELFQNYPNPFNPNTIIDYKLKVTGLVTIRVYSMEGKFIKNLVNQKLSAGEYQVQFDASNYSSSVYFYSLFVNGVLIDTKKMILIK